MHAEPQLWALGGDRAPPHKGQVGTGRLGPSHSPKARQCKVHWGPRWPLHARGERQLVSPGWPHKPGPQARWWGQHLFPQEALFSSQKQDIDSETQGGTEAHPGLAEGLRGQRRGGGQGLWAKATAARPPPTGHWSGHCPRGCRPGQALAKPCCPIAGTGGPSEIRVHWASLASLADDKPGLSGV